MIKTCLISDWNWDWPAVELVKLSSRGPDKGWFEKRGSVLLQKVADLRPVKGHAAVFMIPMGAMEVTGSNRNADAWPATARTVVGVQPAPGNPKFVKISAGLAEQHPTFVTHAKVFHDHDNRDPGRASGFNHLSAYNWDMGRIEVISFVKEAAWEKELDRLDRGEQIEISMASAVPFDYCSVCLNKARTRAAYCDHLQFEKNAILEDGHQIWAVNEKPTFIDLSGVHMNADRIGYGLARLAFGTQPVAATKHASPISIVDIRNRLQILDKLARIEKELDSADVGQIEPLLRASDPRVRPDVTVTIRAMRSFRPKQVFRVMERKRILLPPKQFFVLICGKDAEKFKEQLPQIIAALPSIFGRLQQEGETGFVGDQAGKASDLLLPSLNALTEDLEPGFSLRPKFVRRRISLSVGDFAEPPKTKGETKSAAANAEGLAREYGKYVVAFLANNSDPADAYLAVAANRIGSINS